MYSAIHKHTKLLQGYRIDTDSCVECRKGQKMGYSGVYKFSKI
jgi:hypothetical protein